MKSVNHNQYCTAREISVQVGGSRYSSILVSASSDIVLPFCSGTSFEPKTNRLQRSSHSKIFST